jgi:hypothetical protein
LRIVRLRNLFPSSSTDWHRSYSIQPLVETHYKNLDNWSENFEMLITMLSESTLFTIHQDRDADMLRIMRISCHLWVAIGLNPDAPESVTLKNELIETLERFFSKWAIRSISDWNKLANFPHNNGIYPTLLFIVNKLMAQLQMRAVALLGMVTPTSDGSIHSAFWTQFEE